MLLRLTLSVVVVVLQHLVYQMASYPLVTRNAALSVQKAPSLTFRVSTRPNVTLWKINMQTGNIHPTTILIVKLI